MRLLRLLPALWLGLLLFPIRHALAQAYFNERYPAGLPNTANFAHAVVPTATGYAMLGENYDGPTAERSVVFRLLDSQGNLLHTRQYSRPGFSYAPVNSLMALPDGGFATAVGTFLPSGAGTTMLWRFNAQGDTLWTRTYNVASLSFAFGLCCTRDGGFAIAGEIFPVANSRQMLLARTDSAGNLLWHRAFQLRANNQAFTVAQMKDGGFLVGGLAYDPGGRTAFGCVVRTDSTGHRTWQHAYGDPAWPNGIAGVRPTVDGGFAVLTTIGHQTINSRR